MSDYQRGIAELNRVLGYDVSRETLERLGIYVDLLREWQSSINLVSSSTLDVVWTRHIADSARALTVMPTSLDWIDMGSGAGFPGLVLAICLTQSDGGDGRIDLIESNSKKCAFLRTVIRETALTDSGVCISVHDGRVEDVLPTLPPGVLVARALAPLDRLIGLGLTHLRDGVGVFFKGPDHEREILAAQKKWTFVVRIESTVFDGRDLPILVVSDVRNF